MSDGTEDGAIEPLVCWDGLAVAVAVCDGDAPTDSEAVPVPLLVAVPVPVGDAVGSDEGVALAVVVVDGEAPVDLDAVADGATLFDKLTDAVSKGALVPLIDGATEGLREMDTVAGFDGLAEIEMDEV